MRLLAYVVLLAALTSIACSGSTYETVNVFEEEDSGMRFDAASLSEAQSGGWSSRTIVNTRQSEPQSAINPTFARAEYYTVRFGVHPPPSGQFACIATVSWMLQGNIITRQVSVSNGAAISGTAQGVDVKLTDVTTLITDGLLNPSAPYSIDVQVSPGVRPVEEVPPTLIAFPEAAYNGGLAGLVVLTPGAVIVYDVPQAAGVVSVEVTVDDATPAGTSLNAQVQQVNTTGSFVKVYDPTVDTGFVSLANGCKTVAIKNNSVTDNLYVYVQWGVEG